jgi:hypothetical protein
MISSSLLRGVHRAAENEERRRYFIRNDIFDFFSHNGGRCFRSRCEAVRGLKNPSGGIRKEPVSRRLLCGSCPIHREQCNLVLPPSFICTTHCFDIVEVPVHAVQCPAGASSIGYDIGYELKLVFSGRPVAFDNSPDGHQSAADLLA